VPLQLLAIGHKPGKTPGETAASELEERAKGLPFMFVAVCVALASWAKCLLLHFSTLQALSLSPAFMPFTQPNWQQATLFL